MPRNPSFSRVFFLPWLLLLFGILVGCPRSGGPELRDPVETPAGQDKSDPAEGQAAELPENPDSPLAEPKEKTPRELLEKVVLAYRTSGTYTDHGTVRLVGKMVDPDAEPSSWPCTVAFEAPGKLRLEVHEGVMVSDGLNCYAQIRSLPDQVLNFRTPVQWTFDFLFRDFYLDEAMDLGLPEHVLRFPPQLILLFARDPLKTLLPDDGKAEFLAPAWVENVPCDRIRVFHPEGNRTLWISRKNRALVRFDYLVEGLPVPTGVESLRMLRIDMPDAAFDLNVAPEAFRMSQPVDAKPVAEFEPIEFKMLGQKLTEPETLKIAEIDFVDNEPVAPEIVTLADLAGETSVFCFWTTWSEASRGALEELARVRDALADAAASETEASAAGKVRFFAVNLDSPTSIYQAFDKPFFQQNRILGRWELSWPIYWVEGDSFSERLALHSFPTLVVVSPAGTVELYYRGIVSATSISRVIHEIRSGGTPSKQGLAYIRRRKEEHQAALRGMEEQDYYAVRQATPEPAIDKPAPEQAPTSFSLQKLWSLPLKNAGNLTVLESDGAQDEGDATRLFVPFDGNSLAVIGLDGTVLKQSKPEGLSNDESISQVRTGQDEAGNALVALSSVGGQTLHVYTENLEPVFRFSPCSPQPSEPETSPNEAERVAGTAAAGGEKPDLSKPKQVITDFRFLEQKDGEVTGLLLGSITLDQVSADGDALRIIDLDGKKRWTEHGVPGPFQVGAVRRGDRLELLVLSVLNQEGRLLKFDRQGKRLGGLELADDRQALWFCVGETEKEPEIAVIVSDAEGDEIVLTSFDAEGSPKWSCPLTAGDYRNPIDQVLSVDWQETKAWLVPAPDGSVRLIDLDGTLVDTFSFGKFLSGIAVVRQGDRRLLVTAAADGITAWQIGFYCGGEKF